MTSRRARTRAIAVASGFAALAGLIAAPAVAAPSGSLAQLAGGTACTSEGGTGGCTAGIALDEVVSVAVSPDGRNVYVTAYTSDAVAVFDRNPATGALTQRPGTAGCVSETGSGGSCADGLALNGAHDVVVSPDGEDVYVASRVSSAVASFNRDTATGTLTQKPGTEGCTSEDGTGGLCVNGSGLSGAVGVAANSTSVYVASTTSSAVAVFDRHPVSGILTQQGGGAGCISEAGGSGCAEGDGLGSAQHAAISPDGASVYVTGFSSDAVAVFDRNTGTGAITQKAGTAGCVSDDGSAGDCVDGVALNGAQDVVVSGDNASVYVAAINANGVTVFDRNTSTGGLIQKAGTAACITNSGAGGCTTGTALTFAYAVAIGPDGRNVYAVGNGAGSAVTLDRVGGALSQPASGSCVSSSGSGGACAFGVGLGGPEDVAVSADGQSAYVASSSSDAVAALDVLKATASLTPSRLDFSAAVGSSESKALVVTNGGDADLITGAAGLSSSAQGFAVASDCAGKTIAPGGTCTFNATFTPTAAGQQTAGVSVDTNVGTVAATLTGSGSLLPTISKLRLSRKRVTRRALRRSPRALRISAVLSSTASVRYTVKRIVGKKKRSIGSFTKSGKTGRNRIFLPKKLARKLGRARYVLEARASNAVGSSQVKTARFRVI
ncbi:MAG: beta-propeller fold lactonase family protein [Solirubrobacterales bacterium]